MNGKFKATEFTIGKEFLHLLMKIMKHIVIATTFRDFNGSENDHIQHRFLNSLAKQTFRNFTLAVTIFREQKVENVINNCSFDLVIFKDQIANNKKFCLTNVFANGMRLSLDRNSDALIWTTCDVILRDDFLEIFTSLLRPESLLTSHPHIIEGQNRQPSIDSGFDIVGFGSKTFQNSEFQSAIHKYIFYDWGLFEHFLVAIGKHYCCKAINLYNKSPILKVENDREPGGETVIWLENCWNLNKKTFDLFLQENNETFLYYSLAYCHSRFRMTSHRISQAFVWLPGYARYLKYRIKVYVSSILSQSIKLGLKKLL